MDFALLIYVVFSGILFIFLFLLMLELIMDLFFKKVPYVRSENKVLENAFAIIKPEENQIVYDLGSGDGKFLRTLTKKYPNVKAVGFERSLLPFLISKLIPNKKFKIKYKNFYKQDFSEANYIYAYLFPEYMKNLEEKVKRELKPGAKFVSSTFSFPNWTPARVIPLPDSKSKNWGKLYIYEK